MLVVFGGVFVIFDLILRRHHLCAVVNRTQSLAIIRIDKAKFELRYSRKLVTRLLDFGGIQPGNLNQNSILTDWADDRFAAAKIINPLPNDLDCLIEQSGRNRLVFVELL